MSLFKWQAVEAPSLEKVSSLRSSLKIPLLIAKLLVQRGIESFDTAKHYFRPGLDDNHDAFLMHDMDKAVERIQRAMHSNERILIYGDYDVDGTTAVALFYGTLSKPL